MKDSLDFIYKEQEELSKFGGINALLGWDQMTYMPTKGAVERSDQISLISRLSHEKFTSDKLWNHVRKLVNQDNLGKLEEKDNELVKANVKLEEDVHERERLINELEKALSEVKTLSGLLPICAGCKRIRDDKGYWNQIEAYIHEHSEAQFSHSLCPDCVKRLYPDLG